ncbi:hypothetical protein [Sanyastnella coralliicola]|uniref:hypothetical protein n=1 Tax=Sanyastnella coralliicola TaxID=3069118 RepID=UPI0027BA71A9|nr:hypothetical protein [Longitalea sp. SCSIO 12813]
MRIALSLTFLCVVQLLSAQYKGDDFWFAFVPQPEDEADSELSLIIGCDEETVIDISAPHLLWDTTLTVDANSIEAFVFPNDLLLDEYDGASVSMNGIHVNSSAPISLQTGSSYSYNAGSVNLFPSSLNGQHYIHEKWNGAAIGSESTLLMVANEDDTQVSVLQTDGFNNEEQIFFLEEGQVGYVHLEYQEYDWFEVDANHPISVYSVASCVQLPVGCGACDLVAYQNRPNQLSGLEFIVTMPLGSSSTGYSVQATQDDTFVQIGDQFFVLQQGESYSETTEESTLVICSDQPIQVKQHYSGTTCAGFGDPESFFLPDMTIGFSEATFVIEEQVDYDDQHAIHVLASTDHLDEIFLNGQPIDNNEFSATENPDYSYAELPVPPGSYSITSSEPFQAWSYWMDFAISFQSYPGRYTLSEGIGCTDPLACNFNPTASIDIGNCEYAAPFADCNGNCLFDLDLDGNCEGTLGDFLEDGQVNIEDLLEMLNFFGCTEPQCPGDLNQDGITNVQDLIAFLTLL